MLRKCPLLGLQAYFVWIFLVGIHTCMHLRWLLITLLTLLLLIVELFTYYYLGTGQKALDNSISPHRGSAMSVSLFSLSIWFLLSFLIRRTSRPLRPKSTALAIWSVECASESNRFVGKSSARFLSSGRNVRRIDVHYCNIDTCNT